MAASRSSRHPFKNVPAVLATISVLLFPAIGRATEPKAAGPKSPPPMLVAVSTISRGTVEPMREMLGTVAFARVSKVAAEVEGRVAQVLVDDGDRVEADRPLVILDAEILDTAIEGTRSAYEQVLVDLEQARTNLARLKALYADQLVSETAFDDQRFKVSALEKRAVVLRTERDRQLIVKEKKTIRAPFPGVIVEKRVEKGEWVSAGDAVAVLADDRQVDVLVDVPEEQLRLLEVGQAIRLTSGGTTREGRFARFRPRGDLATRSFTIKIRLGDGAGLLEGMAARVELPVGPKVESLLVPRDAVVRPMGRDIVFVVTEGRAHRIAVTKTGYRGLQIGVSGEGLTEGLPVITKGNERVRDGMSVRLPR